jgi:predicted transcriptional regulator
MFIFRRLSAASLDILRAMACGATLKAHRDLEGAKHHRLHMLDGTELGVGEAAVRALERRGLLDSNKKFPAATYILTDKGRRMAERLVAREVRPLTARNYRTK